MDRHDEPTAETLDIAQYATHGFCQGYPLKRHRHEALANAGSLEARRDWARYIGPAGEFGGCNPLNGNFTALVLPLCRPNRIRLVAYILEYAFLHDTVVEGVDSEGSAKGDEFSLGERETTIANVKTGRRQIQAKMMLQLNTTDKVCAARVMDAWKTMLSTTLRDKARDFVDLEDYLDFRIVDTGAPFVESTMLFGMGMTLTKEEDTLLADIIRPCYASLALANDYFSFDREWAEAQSEPNLKGHTPKLINAVWLYMQWRGVNAAIAKKLVVEAASRYETRFLELCDLFRREHAPLDPKLDQYLRALSYQVSGNVVWSLNCPRYHPEYRYDPNAGVEDALTAERRGRDLHAAVNEAGDARGEHEGRRARSASSTASADSDAHTMYSWHRGASSSRSSSVSMASSAGESDDERGWKRTNSMELPVKDVLGAEHLEAPFAYIKSLPSKGVRDKLADALNLWAGLPEETVEQIKEVVGDLHTASLMLDDIEDGSEVRRGYPAAHSVFGVPQTINAASFAIVECLRKTHKLSKVIPGAAEIAFKQLRDLHIGQSHDLHWTRHAKCPTEEEYLDMVSKKTGGLFRLLSRLMCSHLEPEIASAIDDMVKQMGIFFQIRDDYKNLDSAEYASQKGFCEDLDEGKLSFPLIHHLTTSPQSKALQVSEVLEQRRETGAHSLSEAHKRLVLQCLKESASIDYTRDILRRLQGRIEESIAGLERRMGTENWVLRLCMQMLSV